MVNLCFLGVDSLRKKKIPPSSEEYPTERANNARGLRATNGKAYCNVLYSTSLFIISIRRGARREIITREPRASILSTTNTFLTNEPRLERT
jgi:hypothetical protein